MLSMNLLLSVNCSTMGKSKSFLGVLHLNLKYLHHHMLFNRKNFRSASQKRKHWPGKKFKKKLKERWTCPHWHSQQYKLSWTKLHSWLETSTNFHQNVRKFCVCCWFIEKTYCDRWFSMCHEKCWFQLRQHYCWNHRGTIFVRNKGR